VARSEIGPLNVVIGTDIRGLEQGLDRVKRKTKETASEIGKMGNMLGSSRYARSIEGLTQGLGITTSAEIRAMTLKGATLAAAFVAGFKISDNVTREFDVFSGNIAKMFDPRTWRGNWEGARTYAGTSADYLSHGLRAFGLGWVSNIIDDYSDLAGRKAAYEERKAEESRWRQITHRAANYARGIQLSTADTYAEIGIAGMRGIERQLAELENRRASERRKLRADFDAVPGRTGTEARALAAAERAVEDKYLSDRAVLLRDYKRTQDELVRSSKDEVTILGEKLQRGEHAAQLKAIELRYAKQIREAEWDGQAAVADQLRYQQAVELNEARRIQAIERKQERGDLLTEIGTGALNLLGRGADAARLQLNRDIEARITQARESLKGLELQERLGQLETLRKIGMAEITMQGGVGVSSGSEFIGARKRVSGLSYEQVAAAAGEVANAVRVEGWDRQLELLERIADAIGAAGVPGRAS